MKKVTREQFIQFITSYPKVLQRGQSYNAVNDTTSISYNWCRGHHVNGYDPCKVAEEKTIGNWITSMDESNEFFIKET